MNQKFPQISYDDSKHMSNIILLQQVSLTFKGMQENLVLCDWFHEIFMMVVIWYHTTLTKPRHTCESVCTVVTDSQECFILSVEFGSFWDLIK